MRYLIFDTETTGLPRNWNAPITDTNNWPRCVQIAWQLHDEWGKLIEAKNYIVYPEDYNIPYEAQKIHGISTALAQKEGKPLKEVMQAFNAALAQTDFLVGQNLNFDLNIVGAEFVRLQLDTLLHKLPVLDTCTEKTANLCRLPGGKGGKFKLPNLTELHQQLFGTPFMEAHNATADVEATTRCFFELLRQGHFSVQELKNTDDYLEQFQQKNPKTIENWGIVHINLAELSRGLPLQSPEAIVTKNQSIQKNIALSPELEKASFAHLHNHSQYSVLQSTIEIAGLVAQAAKEGQSAVALTDSGNMMGAFAFVQEIIKHNKKNLEKPLKGIIGCELSVCRNRLDKTQKDNGYPIVLLAKNKNGYRNLSVLSSLAYTEGFYYIPRIDKNILQTYTQDLICLTGNLYGEIPQLILSVGEKQAEEALLWYHSIFKENLYLEIMRHSPEGARVPEEEEQVNQVLIQFSKKYHIPLLATNNTYYLRPEQASAHDILLCVKEGEKQNTPIGKGRGFRYGLNNQEYYFKSSQAMKSLFADIPEAILTIQNIIDAVENYDLATPVLLPKFDIPENFNSEDEYLEHLVFAGAVERYPHLTPEIKERICFELSVIAKTGYPGYFLIVQDFIRKAREMGVVVGPGRGSAAGAVVAYCTGITNVDPLEHGLLFERFLNPDRVSMPDIDIDFDDEGRQKVIDYVIHKYGASQVAQIITYGTMAAKSAIRDTARVLDLPLFEADKLSKIFPDSSLGLRALLAATEVEIQEEFKNNSEEKTKAQTLRALSVEKNLIGQTLRQAALLEGSLRNTGTHACGLIITPSDMKALVPIALVKDSEMFCTQFDNAVVEYAGLLKMDFLGLRTLTIIRDACLEIKRRQNIDINIDKIPMDDAKTYELFQRGETIGIFQYESAGMQKYLKELKPTVFGDLVAMNALYRPGPLQYIPSFIRRKNGAEPIQYDIEVSKKYLEETYGIVVYQEQVMLLSQLLADFTKGEADALRKAMGKKQRSELDKMKPQFIAQASAKGHDAKVLEKIWTDWEAFAAYAFNKSHSVCYALVAYQTAYLKANFPAEYMAAVLSNNLNDIKSVSFFIGECKRMKVPVLPADVNEAGLKFSVNTLGSIRFALTAIKGVGQAAVENILQERQKNAFVSIYDFLSRIDLRQCNKKTLEALALSGAFDQFKTLNRWDYFAANAKGQIFIEDLIKYGSKVKEGKQMKKMSLFGDSFIDEVKQPLPEQTEKWTPIYQLEREKEVVGIYISGHPLDQYALEFKFLCNSSTADLTANIEQLKGKAMKMGGVIVDAQHKIAKNGNGYGAFTLKDFEGEYKMMLFGEDYLRFKPFITENILIYLEGTVVNKWGREDALDFKLQKMELLPEVGEKYFKKLSLYIPIGRINAQFTADLQALLLQHKGTKELRIHLVHETENQIFPFKTQNYGVYMHPQLFESLNALDLHYEL